MTHPTEQQSVPKDTCVSSQRAQGTHMQVDNVSWEEDICRIRKLFASSAETWACAKGETVPTCFLQDSLNTAVCISCNRREKSFLPAQTLKSRHRKRDIWASCQQASWATRLTCPGFFSILTMSQSSARVGHTVMCRFCVKLCLRCVAINLDYVCCVWGFINYLPYWRNSRYE